MVEPSLNTWLLLYLGGLLGRAAGLLQEYLMLSREEWSTFRAVGRPWLSFIVQVVLWPFVAVLIMIVWLLRAYVYLYRRFWNR